MADRDQQYQTGQFRMLCALIVYAPLPLGSDRPWAVSLLGLLTGMLLLWNLWMQSGCPPDVAWRRARLPLIVLAVWIVFLLAQTMPLLPVATGTGMRQTISQDVWSTREYIVRSCIYATVFWLSVTLVSSRRRLRILAMVIVFSGLLQAVAGVIIMATGATFQVFYSLMMNPRAHGTFISPNNFAGYLELTLSVGVGLMIASLDGMRAGNWRQRLHGWLSVLVSGKALLRLSLVIMVIGLVASRSRMGNSAFFASLLIAGALTLILHRKRVKTPVMKATMLFISSLIVLDVTVVGGIVGVEKVVQRLEYTNLEKQAAAQSFVSGMAVPVYREESVEERSEAARHALPLVRDYPWAGTGGGTFHLAFLRYQPAQLKGYWDHAHNDFVELASDVGLTGFSILVLLVGHSVWRSVVMLSESADQLVIGMSFASLMGVTALMIHASVDFNFQNPAVAMLFLILLSLPYLSAMPKKL